MRHKYLLAFFICICAALFFMPGTTTGQPGGKKGFGGFGGGGTDVNQMFDRFAKGQTTIVIADTRWFNTQMSQYAAEKGITNGQLTRPQFADFWEWNKARGPQAFGGGKGMFQPGGGGGAPDPGGFGKKKGFNPGGGGDPGMQMTYPPQPAVSADVLNQLADASFRKLDTNGDGQLNADEMPPQLKFNLARWDKNGDGLISVFEYRDYFAARLGGGGGDDGSARGIASIIIEEEELDRKVVVIRAGGKAPVGLPDWFTKLDTDKDGQVALYEWRKGGMDLDEFRAWDLNDDGFITMEEALKVVAATKGTNASLAGTTSSSSGNGDRPQMGQGMGKGKGGNPWGGGKGKGKKDAGGG
jgi:Ca2+-binding EF-hand superfamily protein